MKWDIFALFLVVCVCQCSAISLTEIEDFSNFLLRTSSLLRSNINPYDADPTEDDHISDYAWEESGKFEGDLILNERQRRLIVEDVAHGLSRNGLQDSTKRWPNNEVIYYIQKEHFNSDQIDAIQNGIDDLSQVSCVKFRPYKKGDPDAVVIQGSRRGCFSQVGYQGGYQVLNLSGRHPAGRGCFRHGTVVHELLHTLGFYHMQSSPDRDDYINVHWENIVEPAKHNFRKYNSFSVSDFGVGYDYESVLHYGRKAFSSNGQDTLVPKKFGAQIGQRIGLSDKDTKKLNKMYCDADSNNFEGDDTSPHLHVTKKKIPKNRPFQGHGIGYQKGKTIVIKLPNSETAVINGNKEEQYSYKPPTKSNESKPVIQNTEVSAGKKYNPPIDFNTHNIKQHYDDHPEHKLHVEDNKKIYNPIEQISNSNKAKFESDGVSEAFDRLGNIIKTHVYPSQVPNLSVYKVNTDYSDFYNPNKQFETEAEIKKVDQNFNYHSSSPKPVTQNKYSKYSDRNPLYPGFQNYSLNDPKNVVRIVKEANDSNNENHYLLMRSQDKPEETISDFYLPETVFKKYDYSDYLPYAQTEPVKKLRSDIYSDTHIGFKKPAIQENDSKYYHQKSINPQIEQYEKIHDENYRRIPHEAYTYSVTYPSYHAEDDDYKQVPKNYNEHKNLNDGNKLFRTSEKRPYLFNLRDGSDVVDDLSKHEIYGVENKTKDTYNMPYRDRNREYFNFAQVNSDAHRENLRQSFEDYKKAGFSPNTFFQDIIAGVDTSKQRHKSVSSERDAGVTPSTYRLDKYIRNEPKVHEDYDYSSENSHSVEGYR